MTAGNYHSVCDKVLCLFVEDGSVLELVGEVVEGRNLLGPSKTTEALSGIVENLKGVAQGLDRQFRGTFLSLK